MDAAHWSVILLPAAESRGCRQAGNDLPMMQHHLRGTQAKLSGAFSKQWPGMTGVAVTSGQYLQTILKQTLRLLELWSGE